MPGGDDGQEFLTGEALETEIGVETDESIVVGDMIGQFFGGVPQ